MTDFSHPAHVRSALFVDFDNIYLGLQNEDPRAAEQFATHPGRWLRWLQEDLPNDSRAGRKILSRRCYLNPSQFSRFRPYFIRSAFEVVDCPPLTRGGKTSADIQMVMDIMDALGHVTRFEEFIILSGDADFTPVLLRLSRYDRRSVVLAAGPASAAYKAACDVLIDQDTFLEEAIGIGEGSPVRPGADSELLQRIAAKVHERASAGGELVATDLPGIFREFAEFTPDSNWLGFYSLRGMTSAVVQARRDLEMVEGDPWRVRTCIPPPAAPDGPETAADAAGTAAADAPAGPGTGAGAAPPRTESAGAGGNGGLATAAGANGGASAASPQLLRAIADKVHSRASAAGELLATDLPGIYREFPQFTPNSNWLGFYSLRGLSDAVIRSRTDLEMIDGDPWRVRLRQPPAGQDEPRQRRSADAALPGAAGSGGERLAEAGAGAAPGGGATAAAVAPAAAMAAVAPTAADLERQRQVDTIVEFVRGLVAGSDSPVPVARAAHAVLDRFGEGVAASRWHGAGTFRDLLAGYTDLPFAVSATRSAFLYDPDLHQTPLDHPDDPEIGDAETTSLAHRIHRITDTPYLGPNEYALVFREIAEEVNEEGYFLTRTSKAVRDRCIEEGTPVARTSVNFVLRGITGAGYRFGAAAGTEPLDLANAFVKHVLGLCESAGMPLSEDERQQLTAWIAGGLPPEPG
ncbi:MAG TPA: NYN domain-containing protein [Thermoanaerobaculia bacterium]|nr:NYN domain-containing protein [Thermoanaerobaculia bacterium]